MLHPSRGARCLEIAKEPRRRPRAKLALRRRERSSVFARELALTLFTRHHLVSGLRVFRVLMKRWETRHSDRLLQKLSAEATAPDDALFLPRADGRTIVSKMFNLIAPSQEALRVVTFEWARAARSRERQKAKCEVDAREAREGWPLPRAPGPCVEIIILSH